MQSRRDNSRTIRARTGPELVAKSWATEAAVRMLMNNLDPAVDDQALRVLGDFVVQVVHQHSDGGFGEPALGLDLASAAGADAAAVVSARRIDIAQLSTPPKMRRSGPGRPIQ